jgi:hypothetical protein
MFWKEGSKGSKEKPELNSQAILYGSAPPIKRPPRSEEPQAEEAAASSEREIDGYSVLVRESQDPFLVSNREHWAFRVVSPEGAEHSGRASSQSRAERQVRKFIARDIREQHESRAKKAKRQALLDLLDRHRVETPHSSRLEQLDLEVDELPGGYVLLTYQPMVGYAFGGHYNYDRGKKYQAEVFRNGKRLVEIRRDSRRKAKKAARESLSDFLLAEQISSESKNQGPGI